MRICRSRRRSAISIEGIDGREPAFLKSPHPSAERRDASALIGACRYFACLITFRRDFAYEFRRQGHAPPIVACQPSLRNYDMRPPRFLHIEKVIFIAEIDATAFRAMILKAWATRGTQDAARPGADDSEDDALAI